MTTTRLRWLPLALLSFALPAHAAAPYKWVDDHGITHYSQVPPSGKPAHEIPVPKTPPAAATPHASPQGSTGAKADATKGGAATPEEVDEATRVRQENCRRARENLTVLEANRRIRIKEGDDYRVLDENERLQNMERQRRQIKEYCETE